MQDGNKTFDKGLCYAFFLKYRAVGSYDELQCANQKHSAAGFQVQAPFL